jgi:hypothetical protein
MTAYEQLQTKNYMIGIPSRGRTHLIEKKQGVWKYFLKEAHIKEYPIYVFTRNCECEEYKNCLEKYPWIKIISVPDEIDIATKRNEIYKYADSKGMEYVFIVNDDIDLFFRKEELSSKYTNKFEELMSKNIVEKMLLESVLLCNEEYPITGFPLKLASFALKYTFEKNKQVIHLQCYHVPTLKKEGIQHNGMGVTGMSDRWVQLSLLKLGYKSLANCRYAVSDAGIGQRGGCTEIRTAELVTEAARALRKNFPEVVELKLKNNGKWNTERIDCTIRLKKYLGKGELPYISKEEVGKEYGIEL